MRELRWLADPAWARGVLRTFLAHQNPDGSLPGRVYVDHQRGTDFYHADWGGALDALQAVHPDPAFEAEVYPGLVRYAAWLLRTRDADHTGMIDVVNQFETGQEYMRSEEHTSELQSQSNLVCRLLLEKKKKLSRHRTHGVQASEQQLAPCRRRAPRPLPSPSPDHRMVNDVVVVADVVLPCGYAARLVE